MASTRLPCNLVQQISSSNTTKNHCGGRGSAANAANKVYAVGAGGTILRYQ